MYESAYVCLYYFDKAEISVFRPRGAHNISSRVYVVCMRCMPVFVRNSCRVPDVTLGESPQASSRVTLNLYLIGYAHGDDIKYTKYLDKFR